MSCVPVDGAEACANCGATAKDTVKLKNCTACRLVKYCSVDCQKVHRKQHKKECKQRAAELKDEQLYSQGHERPEGGFCPICTLPIPLPMDKESTAHPCCMKRICNGCMVASQKKGMFDCPFCRTNLQVDGDDALAMLRARVKKKDPLAIKHLGDLYIHGGLGLRKDSSRAVDLWAEAAELGSVDAYYQLGVAYRNGNFVTKDVARGVRFYEKAAMAGNMNARHNLGLYELMKGKYDRAVRHWLISAKMGQKDSLEKIKEIFTRGHATKSQYAEALKGYQDAMEEMKSHDRDEAKRIGFYEAQMNKHNY